MANISTPIAPADGYATSARSAFNGLQVLAETQRLTANDLARNCTLLAALAVECALKHFLATTGTPNNNLRGHNLVDLWERANVAGLAIEAKAPYWCEKLSDVTTGPLFFIRYGYGATGALVIPPPLLVQEITNLLTTIGI